MSTLKQARGPVTPLVLLAMTLSLAGVGCDASKTSSAAEDPPKARDNGASPPAQPTPVSQQAQQTGVTAQQKAPSGRKPNIMFIMGDDIGWMQPSIYHRGLMVGETPNIDRIGKEGAIFMDYVAMQSCTSGRNAFFTGMYPVRTGMIPPQLPGSPSWLRPGTPALAKFLCWISATRRASSARTTSAITPRRCRPRTGSRSTGATSTTWTRCSR